LTAIRNVWHTIRMTTEKIVAANMRRLRPATGRSMRECGKLVGVAAGTWRTWESGQRDIPASRLDGIALVLGVDVAELVTKFVPAPIEMPSDEAA
jgi:transcriptional regulator with XRE-family HTH domain